jgi:threonine dehydrogenase-like Zn-dependent dehydrogenase
LWSSAPDRWHPGGALLLAVWSGRVIVIDHLEYRLDFVRQYAPAEVYNFRSLEDPVYF